MRGELTAYSTKSTACDKTGFRVLIVDKKDVERVGASHDGVVLILVQIVDNPLHHKSPLARDTGEGRG